MLPVDEVGAARVGPVSAIPRVRVERVELVEDVVVALVQEGAVYVVHPTRRRAEVIDRSRRIGGSLVGAGHHGLHAGLNFGVLVVHASYRFPVSWNRVQIRYHTRGWNGA